MKTKVLAIAIVLSIAPTASQAQTREMVDQAAANAVRSRSTAVMACVSGMTALTVDMRFAANGQLNGANIGGAPQPVIDCVARALAGVALPGAVREGTVVRYVFQGAAAAPPQPVIQPQPQQPVIQPQPQQPVI